MSKRYNALEEKFEEVTVLGKQMLFTCDRIDRSTVPEGLYMYEVRHDDEGQGDPCEIAYGIMVNHWGTLITNEQIEMNEWHCRFIDPEEDWSYYTGDCRTVTEYVEKYGVNKQETA